MQQYQEWGCVEIMLNDLQDLQETDENLWRMNLSFDIETHSEDGNELVHKTYTFSYAREWDLWTFKEYHEERTPDTKSVTERNWTRSRHVIWQDIEETRTIDVPTEVTDALEEATGSESVTIQVPRGSIGEKDEKIVNTGD